LLPPPATVPVPVPIWFRLFARLSGFAGAIGATSGAAIRGGVSAAPEVVEGGVAVPADSDEVVWPDSCVHHQYPPPAITAIAANANPRFRARLLGRREPGWRI
jgi:hypothetical protein